MHPPTRQMRMTNAPGLVDLPKPHKSTADVTTEKKKKEEAAVAKAKVKDAKVVWVARVEKEIRIAQREAMQMQGQVGKVGQTKKTFKRENPAKGSEKVSQIRLISAIFALTISSHDEVPFPTQQTSTRSLSNSPSIIHDISSNMKISLRNPDI